MFVPLFSPRYFASERCGKEWYAFAQRVIRQLPLPDEQLRFDHRALGERYAIDGLCGLIKLRLFAEEYRRAAQANLWKRGELTAASALGEELRDQWREELGCNDIQYLYLRFHISNVRRSQGRYAEALELDEETLERQPATLGPTHPHTYMTTSALAMDLGALGRYERRSTWRPRRTTASARSSTTRTRERWPRPTAWPSPGALPAGTRGPGELDQDVYDRRTEARARSTPTRSPPRCAWPATCGRSAATRTR